MPKPQLVTKAQRAKHEEELRRLQARLQDDLRLEFYRRQGIEPPQKEVVPSSPVVITGDGVPVRMRRAERNWTCSRDGCEKTFWLNTRQRKQHDEGYQRFYCTQECRILAHKKPMTQRELRDQGSKKLSLSTLRKHALPLLAEYGGRYTWTSLAVDLGFFKQSKNCTYGDAHRAKVALGYSLKAGQAEPAFVRRETVDRFERILGEEFWK